MAKIVSTRKPRAKKEVVGQEPAVVIVDEIPVTTELSAGWQEAKKEFEETPEAERTAFSEQFATPGHTTLEEVVRESEEKDTTWRLLNRVKFEDAKPVYARLENKYRQFDSESRKEQGEHAFDLSKSMLKELRAGAITQRTYDEEYARAWKERADLEKGVIRSTAWVMTMNRSLVQECGWTLHEYLECQKGGR